MTIAELHKLGYITKLHGYKGELTAHLDTIEQRDYEDLKHLFLDVKGQLIPYEVILLEYKTNTTVKVKLSGVETEDAAKMLVKSSIYINPKDLSEADEDKLEFRRIIGYSVVDSEKGSIGKVAFIEELETNPLLVIDFNGKQILLPLNGDFIDEIGHEKKEVLITAPAGLIDFYLAN